MIKIKEFAKLCQCSTQTLRYYDQVKLLSPIHVDRENNYRYYTKNQLFDYIKIKNLQLADFSISEIKSLLKSSDEEIYLAFDQKISNLEERLAKTLKIKETYHIENNIMEKLLQLIKENVKNAFDPELVKQEYKISDSEVSTYVEEWEEMFTNALLSDENMVKFTEAGLIESGLTEEQMIQALGKFKSLEGMWNSGFDPDPYPVLREFHAWAYLHEIMTDLCQVEDGANIIYYLNVTPDKLDLAFTLPTILLQTVLRKNPGKSLQLECQVGTSSDKVNHVYILDKLSKGLTPGN